MALDTTLCTFTGRMVIVGFGSIGQGVLPLLLRHIGGLTSDRITIVTAEERGREEAELYGVAFHNNPLDNDNFFQVLKPLLDKGDFLVNLSVDVSSIALIEFCQRVGAYYTDTCIEPWAGGYTDPNMSPSLRSNYALRETALALRGRFEGGPTALITHGANPGLVSHFVKQALLNIADDTGIATDVPADRAGWGRLAQRLGIKTIHIAERDTQVSNQPKQIGEFVNTWSIDGFVSEGCQPAELGWGTHERHFPDDGRRHEFGCDSAIYLMRPGAATRVRTWTPLEGPFHGFLITHSESISISDYFTVREGGKVAYRPTCHYAYHPCDDAVMSLHELAGKNFNMQAEQRLMMAEITSGTDELGVLLMGNPKGAYWFGSRLSIDEARALAPYNNATSMQVTSTVLGGIVWALENPNRGIVEPDEVDFRRVLDIAMPYLGDVVGAYGDWTPLQDRNMLFPEDVDDEDPWQFKNFRVI
ncbi:homospermidine synthase [Azospirillum picis]|uniref:Homospermidine synthase n=1 Tax=Azospirillum picis TaxID=488438 RepID=A0ABU0MGA2_9PROT|nr:saccharopine dehydrogenase C-terminal domain-containing protein [Azospirillum picis]MBP2298502.1 homospermidine synthase [Azospirillum picis]MDQ0532449.1 homospermidine synthase [Azospirillum picis]